MEFIGWSQVYFIIIITIMTLLYIFRRSLTFSCWGFSSSSSAAAAADDDDDDADIPPPREKYDVFISFRGEDTRLGITSHLHAALLEKKIETYIDYRLVRGDEVGPALLEAIEKSTLSVIIFSQNYASSTWCLDELAHILKCKKKYGHMVIPIFYDINPSDVRKQQGSYAVAFAQLEKRFKNSMDKVHKWRAALTTTANLSGFDYSNKTGTEADLIKKVVADIWTKLIRESSCDLSGLVGIRSRIEQIESLLCIHSPDACITVGIWGMGGIGKTTLAEAVFHRLSSEFEAFCFLRNVREREKKDGLAQLWNTLVSEILKERDLSMGSTFVRKTLSRTKLLIVLDDVSDSMQMERLAGDDQRYGTGSRIIITSRDRSTLMQFVEDDKIYEVEGLESDDALQLFHLNAFKNNTPRTDYTKLSLMAADYAGGIPLALKILGSSLHRKSKEVWEDELNKLKQFPSEKIQKVLRISYDGLEKNEKEIFLDIACFHKGKHMDDVKKMLDIRGFFVAAGIRVLIDMSLISIVSYTSVFSTWKKIEMHDLLQEMGKAIVLEQCVEEPGKRSRLYIAEDVYHILKNNTGTAMVQAIFFNRSKIEELDLNPADFKQMSKLILLGVDYSKFDNYCELNTSLDLPNSLRYLCWHGYPWKSLPSKFSPVNLVELHMPHSQVEQLWNADQRLLSLTTLKLSDCKSLKELPASFCKLKSLKELDLTGCTKFKNFPELLEQMEHLEFLSLERTSVFELHSSIEFLPILKKINLRGCRMLGRLPTSICKLKYLEGLDLTDCFRFHRFPEILEPMKHIQFLRLEGTMVNKLPSSIENLIRLQTLDLRLCQNFEFYPKSIYNVTNLQTLSFRHCWKLKTLPPVSGGLLSLEKLDLCYSGLLKIPHGLICSTSLRDLDLRRSMIKCIPASIKQASCLRCLRLSNCKRLQSLPELPVLQILAADGCTSLKTVSRSRTALFQGWDNYELFRGVRQFYNCRALDQNARSNIMADARLRILRVATASSKFREEDHGKSPYRRPLVTIVYQGKEIPYWFSYQNVGSSIKLPPDWFRTGFLGFALCVVIAYDWYPLLWVGVNFNFKASNGESHEISCRFHSPRKDGGYYDYTFSRYHVHVWYHAFELVEGEKFSTNFYELVTEASVDFCPVDTYDDPDEEEDTGGEATGLEYKVDYNNGEVSKSVEKRKLGGKIKNANKYGGGKVRWVKIPKNVMVEKCGVCPLYAEDAEKLKFDVMSGEPKVEDDAGQADSDASGSYEPEEASDIESEAWSDESEESWSDEAEEGASHEAEASASHEAEASASEEEIEADGSDECAESEA